MVITLGIHFAYRFWWVELQFWPIHDTIQELEDWLSSRIYLQGSWIVGHILGIPFERREIQQLVFEEGHYIIVNNSCSGFKQIVQFVLLFIIYPGPWKHKVWVIPAGILIVHLTNLFRIAGLSVVMIHAPNAWEFSHDYLFRPFFYLVIFIIWMVWEEKFRKG